MIESESDKWRELVFQHWNLLERLAARRFPDPNVANETLLYVERGLEADDRKRLRAFKGKARMSTFIAHVAYNLLEDFARHRYGRFRPPTWIKGMGSLWVQVYRLLCLERMTAADIATSLTASAPGTRPAELVEEAIAVILEKTPECGLEHSETTHADPNFLESQKPLYPTIFHLSPEHLLAAHERAAIVTALGRCLISSENIGRDGGRLGAAFVAKLRPQLTLTNEERLLLKMVFQDGLQVSAAGRLLGLQSDQVHGRLRRLLKRLRNAFEKSGTDRELKVLLDDSHE